MNQRYNESTAPLKELMTANPINPKVHAALLRSKVDARRLVEDAMDAAKERRQDSL